MQGYQGHQNVSKRRPHHSGDICTTRENNLKTIFSFMGQNVKKKYILGVFWGPWLWTTIVIVFGGHGGPLHKIQRYCGHQNVGKCRIQRLTTNFWYMGQHMNTNIYFVYYLGGPWGGPSMIRLNLSCFPAILSPISMYMWNKEAIWKDIFKFKPKIWQNNTFFHIWGVLGGPYIEPRWTKISGH